MAWWASIRFSQELAGWHMTCCLADQIQHSTTSEAYHDGDSGNNENCGHCPNYVLANLHHTATKLITRSLSLEFAKRYTDRIVSHWGFISRKVWVNLTEGSFNVSICLDGYDANVYFGHGREWVGFV